MTSGTLTLEEIEEGESAEILSIDADGGKFRKFIYMGLYPGATVRVIRRGPAGNPIEVLVDDLLRIAVRKRDARMVKVRKGS